MSNPTAQLHPSIPLKLAVNADDLGLSHGVNRGIIEAHEHGIVTSASLMVRWPAAKEAVELARRHPSLGIGLHLDLGEWANVDYQWVPRYSVVDTTDPAAVEAEVQRQLARFFELVGRAPTHIDSHQHVHREPAIAPIVLNAARPLGVVVRHLDPRVAYCGNFYGQDGNGEPYHQAITPEALVEIVRSLTAPVTELACHPGYGADLDTMYRLEREMELAALRDPRVKQTLAERGVRRVNFGEVGAG